MPDAEREAESAVPGADRALTSTSTLANSSNADTPQPSSQLVLAPLARTTSETA